MASVRARSGIVVATLALVLVAGALALTWRPSIAPIEPQPTQAFDGALVKRGRDLAALGNCTTCHTVRGGRDFAGGLPVPTPFGTIFSTNITPDRDTGIGQWSEAAFRRAMRSGIDRAGQHLYPTFPYDHFTNVSEDDDRALYAFLMTRPAVNAPPHANALVFPLNMRPVIAGWKLLFFHNAAVQPDPAKSAEWNRGAYLVEGLAHCGACHTPRNVLGAEKASAAFGGGDVDGWQAYPLNDASKAPVPWTTEALFTYLRTGSHPAHGLARGPMEEVVGNLASVSNADVRAIATYMANVSGAPSPDRQRRGDDAIARAESAKPSSSDHAAEADTAHPAGAAVYKAACAGCHETGRALPYGGVNLHLSTGISASDARNATNTILFGVRPVDGERSAIMPGYADNMSDGQIVALMDYLRARFSDQPAWANLDAVVRDARQAQLAYMKTTPGPQTAPVDAKQRDAP